jgi:hypothetical protein
LGCGSISRAGVGGTQYAISFGAKVSVEDAHAGIARDDHDRSLRQEPGLF